MIEKMTKYSFILLSGKTEEFLRRLQELGLVDITRSSKPVDERSAALLSMTNELKKAASKLESLDYSQDPDLEKIEAEVDADAKYDNPLESFKEYSTKLDVLRNELAQARKDVESRRPWGCYDSFALDALKAKGYKVSERLLSIDEICEAYDKGEFKEMFASGTAAIISPVGELRYKEKTMNINGGEIGPVAQLLYDTIYGTQIGEVEDEFGWVVPVE